MAPGAPRAFGLGVLVGGLVCAGCVAAVLLLCPGTPSRTQSHITRFQAGNLLLPKAANAGFGHGLSARARQVGQVRSQRGPARGIGMVAAGEEESQWGRHVLDELGRAPGPETRGGAGAPVDREAVVRGMVRALVDYEAELRAFARRDMPGLEEKLGKFQGQVRAATAALVVAFAPQAAFAAGMGTVDKTGFIGGIAEVIENGIDFGHDALLQVGLQNTYGLSICLFTVLIKFLTLPLITTQIESSTQIQKIQPLQKQIMEMYPDENNPMMVREKNIVLTRLFQVAQVNPLAALLPAFAQIPVFIGLYRALQNLEAEKKMSEPFLWLPNLEGPTYDSKPGETMQWVTSFITLNPQLGYEQTVDFLSLPLILFVVQKLGQKVLQPPQDPSREVTQSERISQRIVEYLPFLTCFFSLNMPSGLAIYWVTNSILTTLLTLVTKNFYADQSLPPEVDEIMQMVAIRNAQLAPQNAAIVLPTKAMAVGTASAEPTSAPAEVASEPISAPIQPTPEGMAPSEAASADTSTPDDSPEKSKTAMG